MNFDQARDNMVLNQLRANRIRDMSLIEKIEIFPRESLYPIKYKHLSYSDRIITLNDGRFILPPLTAFHLVQALEINENDYVLEVGSGFGTTTSIINQFTSMIDCIETSMEMIESFQLSIEEKIFKANLLKTTIDEFFDDESLNLKKYQKILINGTLDQEPLNIIKNSSNDAQIVCVIDNKEFKHKIVKYLKVKGNSNRFIVDEASSSFIYKFIKKEPFVF
jgi:protein-L-isoaspartate(D-aspartate) O-methyltransferase